MAVKNNKKMFYCNYQILGQAIEPLNPPEDINSYAFKEREVTMTRPCYDENKYKLCGRITAILD